MANIDVLRDGKPYTIMHPAKWAFRHHEDEPPTSEVDIHKTLGEDLYVVLNGYDPQSGIANLKVVINPLVNWIWLGFLLLIVGTVIAFLPDRAYALASARRPNRTRPKAAAATALLFMLLRVGERARAQEMQRAAGELHMPRNDHERVLFGKLKCMCGLPARAARVRRRVRLARDAASRGAAAARRRARATTTSSKFELAKYGEEMLRVPLDTGYRRLVWVLPVASAARRCRRAGDGGAPLVGQVQRSRRADGRGGADRRPGRRVSIAPRR